MDRQIVWAGALPLETDILNTNRNAMIALGRIAMDMLGTSALVSGLTCTPATIGMGVVMGAGAIYSMQNVDNTAYSSIAADTVDQVMKQGILLASASPTLTLAAPTTASYSVIYLIEAAFTEVDTGATTLAYFNSANTSQPFSGPNNSGAQNFTMRSDGINLVAKVGIAATTPVAPAVDTGFVPLYYVTIAYGATSVVSGNIAVATGAPFISANLGNIGTTLAGYLTTALAASTYLTQTAGASTYLTQAAGASTYLTQTAGASTYLTQATGASTYLTQAAGASLAPLASPALTGSPTAPTPAQFDNSSKLATTAFVQRQSGNFAGYSALSGAQTLGASVAGFYVANTTTGVAAWTLPNATVGAGYCLTIENAGTGVLTLTSGSGNFTGPYGSASTTLALAVGQTVEMVSDGTKWHCYVGSTPVAQTWTNVTGSRAAGTSYTNSTSLPILVSMSISSNESGLAYAGSVVVGGVTIATGIVGDIYSGHASRNITFTVPVGATYQVNLGTGGTVANWAELR